VNQVWVLAQIHIGRPFAIYSELNDSNIMRYKIPNCFSAFAKEIATAIKAEYTIHVADENERIILLNPPIKEKMANQLTIEAINVSDTEIKSNIEKVLNAKDNKNELINIRDRLSCKITNPLNTNNNTSDVSLSNNSSTLYRTKTPQAAELGKPTKEAIHTNEINEINYYYYDFNYQ
jgi:hypothetical protein